MSDFYFTETRGDKIVITCELPRWARTDKMKMVIATHLCSLAQTLRIAPWDDEKIGWFLTKILLYGQTLDTICVFVRGDQPIPEPEATPDSEISPDDILKGDGNGKTNGNPKTSS